MVRKSIAGMIALISAADAVQRAGWPVPPQGHQGPLAAVTAEFIRAALCNVWQGHPVSVHSILSLAEGRLGALFSFQSSLQAQIFGDDSAEDSSREELRAVLDWLVEAGDVISVGHGWYYPSPTRLVELPSRDFALVSGASSEELERTLGMPVRSGAIGRVVHAIPNAVLIQESFRNWLGVPSSLGLWTRQMLATPLTPLETDASKWEVAHYSRGLSFGPAVESDLGQLVVARVKREGMSGYVRYLARLRRQGNLVATQGARELRYHDCTRLMNGIRRERGLPGERIVARACDASYVTVTTTKYQLPEVLAILTFLCVHRASTSEHEHTFWIPKRHEPRLEVILDDLGVKLTNHG